MSEAALNARTTITGEASRRSGHEECSKTLLKTANVRTTMWNPHCERYTYPLKTRSRPALRWKSAGAIRPWKKTIAAEMAMVVPLADNLVFAYVPIIL
jgi:hypothetical protein